MQRAACLPQHLLTVQAGSSPFTRSRGCSLDSIPVNVTQTSSRPLCDASGCLTAACEEVITALAWLRAGGKSFP